MVSNAFRVFHLRSRLRNKVSKHIITNWKWEIVENITEVCKKCFSFRKVINERIYVKFRLMTKHNSMCVLAMSSSFLSILTFFVDNDATFLVDFDGRIYFSDKCGCSDVAQCSAHQAQSSGEESHITEVKWRLEKSVHSAWKWRKSKQNNSTWAK